MPISLKPHNEETYQKVEDKMKETSKVAVVHPTGTGKMFVALKLIEENSEKKAIYVAPSSAILHDVKKNIFAEGMTMQDFPNLRRITYQKLARLTDEEIEELGADIIILDEFHHCGAPEWGKGVERLMQRNPSASVLGLSATPLRYTDGLRDMADELFENNVASEMTLEQAIEERILSKATYVSALDEYNEELERLQSNVDKIKDEAKKAEAQELLNSLRKKLDENTQNLPELLQEHMKNKNGKYIVFCKNIDDMNEKIKNAQKMFGNVNPNITVRAVSSKIKEADKVLTEFEQDTDESTLKLLFAVNMLNEGYHVKDLDGVIMMRPTFSPAVYTQQLGRALTVGGEKEPVVLDLVDNFDSCKIIEDFAQRMKQYKGHKKENKGKYKNNEESSLSIFDTTKEFREIVKKIDELSQREEKPLEEKTDNLSQREWLSLEEKIKVFERFANTGEEIDGNTIFEGYPIGYWAIQIRHQVKAKNEGKEDKINLTEEQLEQLESMGMLERQIDSTVDEKIDFLIEWKRKYPKTKISPKVSDEVLKEYAKTEEEYKQIKEEYEKTQRYYSYVKYRKYKGKLSDEQIVKCKEGNVGGTFGYPTLVEEQAKLYGVKEKDIDYIFSNYGTIENFYKLYRSCKLNSEEDRKLASVIIKDIIDLDGANNPRCYELIRDIDGDYNSRYDFDEIIRDVMKYNSIKENQLIVYSSKKIRDYINTKCDRRTTEVVKKLYDLTGNGEHRNQASVVREEGLSKQTVSHIITKFSRTLYKEEIIYEFEKIRNEELMTAEEIQKLDEAQKILDDISLSKIDASNEEARECLAFIKDMSNTEFLEERRIEKKQKGLEEELRSGNLQIEKLGLSFRASNGLKRAGINTVGDICSLSQEELMKIKDLGDKSCNEIIEKIYSLGLHLRERDNGEGKTDEEKLKILIEDSTLFAKTRNSLKKAGLRTIGDICCLSGEGLAKIRNLGNKSCNEIIKNIHSMGLHLRGEKTVEEKQKMPLEELDFSVRASNCLKRAGINTVEDICNLNEKELAGVKNFGNKCYNEVIEKIHLMGLHLSGEEADEEKAKGQKDDGEKIGGEETESKDALVEKILAQQQKIEEQQKEIEELKSKIENK